MGGWGSERVGGWGVRVGGWGSERMGEEENYGVRNDTQWNKTNQKNDTQIPTLVLTYSKNMMKPAPVKVNNEVYLQPLRSDTLTSEYPVHP